MTDLRRVLIMDLTELYERRRFISTHGSCQVGGREYFIDRGNILYSRGDNGQIRAELLLQSGRNYAANFDRRYLMQPLAYREFVICIPNIGQYITFFNTVDRETKEIYIGDYEKTYFRAGLIYNNYLYLWSSFHRLLLRINLAKMSLETVADYGEQIAVFDRQGFFYTQHFLYHDNKVYMGLRSTPDIITYDLRDNKLDLFATLRDGYDIEHMFLHAGELWLTSMKVNDIVILNMQDKKERTVSFDFPKASGWINLCAFWRNKAMIFPIFGARYAVYDFLNDTISYSDLDELFMRNCGAKDVILENVQYEDNALKIYLRRGGVIVLEENNWRLDELDKNPGVSGKAIFEAEWDMNGTNDQLIFEDVLPLAVYVDSIIHSESKRRDTVCKRGEKKSLNVIGERILHAIL